MAFKKSKRIGRISLSLQGYEGDAHAGIYRPQYRIFAEDLGHIVQEPDGMGTMSVSLKKLKTCRRPAGISPRDVGLDIQRRPNAIESKFSQEQKVHETDQPTEPFLRLS
jgi:hypothetical protein